MEIFSITAAVIAVIAISYALHLRSRLGDLQSSIKQYEAKLSARQSNGGMRRIYPDTRPEMQQAITTRRDSDDIPGTGRQAVLSNVVKGRRVT